LRVPKAVGDFIMLDILRKSGGTAVSVTDNELIAAVKEIGSADYLGNFHCGVVGNDSQLISRDVVTPPDDEVSEISAGNEFL